MGAWGVLIYLRGPITDSSQLSLCGLRIVDPGQSFGKVQRSMSTFDVQTNVRCSMKLAERYSD